MRDCHSTMISLLIDEMQLCANSLTTNNKAYVAKRCGFHSSDFLPSSLSENSLFRIAEFRLYA